jgi:VWFA-related protein
MRLILIIFLAAIFTGPTTQAQEPEIEKLVIDTRLVSVPVIVSDRSGHYVPNLRPQNFKLYDNNVEQKIAFFDAAEEPLNVVLLLDTSRSTRGVLDDIRSAAREFLRALRPKDRAMIVSFDKDVEQLSPMTSDHRALEKAISRAVVSPYFGTLLNDAVAKTSSTFLQTVNGRKAIVVLTDGEDGGSQTGARELLAHESEADAMIYPIYYEAYLHDGGGGMFSGLRSIFGKSEKKTPVRLQREAAPPSSDKVGRCFRTLL